MFTVPLSFPPPRREAVLGTGHQAQQSPPQPNPIDEGSVRMLLFRQTPQQLTIHDSMTALPGILEQ